jgi:hypothetical protein
MTEATVTGAAEEAALPDISFEQLHRMAKMIHNIKISKANDQFLSTHPSLTLNFCKWNLM